MTYAIEMLNLKPDPINCLRVDGIIVEQGSTVQTIQQIFEDYYDKAQDVPDNNKCYEHVEEIKNLRKEVENLKNRILSLEKKSLTKKLSRR